VLSVYNKSRGLKNEFLYKEKSQKSVYWSRQFTTDKFESEIKKILK
jgi:hypothetical protein